MSRIPYLDELVPMSRERYNEGLQLLGWTPRKFAKATNVGERNARRWAKEGGIPDPTALLLMALVRLKYRYNDSWLG